MLSCASESRAFRIASKQVAKTQENLLFKIIAKNCDTAWGRQHGFNSIHSVDTFRKQVPLIQYEDCRDAINRISEGEQAVLTKDRVELLEPTSGSTTGEKLIPYTAGLKSSFQRALRAWIWDLFYHRPALRAGTAYWSISPLANIGRTTPAGIPIGFDDDSAYLGSFERRMLSRTLAVPPEVALCGSVLAAQYATLFFLLRDSRLALISVWSPTFLIQLLSSLQSNIDNLCDDIERGSISLENSALVPSKLTGDLTPQPARANELRRIFQNTPADWVKRIWPCLSLVSCWTDGPSAISAGNLAVMLPGVEIQPKGLLATEAVVTIPLLGLTGGALAVRSNFFEFLPAAIADTNDGENSRLAHQLELDNEYRVVVTTSGGLYRYQLNDQVRVVGFYQQLPLLQFVGKADDTMDLVGEKLSAVYLQRVITEVFDEFGVQPAFVEICARSQENARYVLRLADDALAGDAKKQCTVCNRIDHLLRSNPGYGYARNLGQLECLELQMVTPREASQLTEERTVALIRAGMRHGDIKPSFISRPERGNYFDSNDANDGK
jgi:hypothetical protein